MLDLNQDRKGGTNAPKMGRSRRLRFILKERTPKDFFLVGVGVLVAVKNPVRTSVLVVMVTLVPANGGDVVDVAELQSEDAS